MNVHLRILPSTHAATDGVVMHQNRSEMESSEPESSETVMLEPLTDDEKTSASTYLQNMISTLPDCEGE